MDSDRSRTLDKNRLRDLTDVTSDIPADENVLSWDNSIKKWKPVTLGSIIIDVGSLNDLSDVTISSPTTGQVLRKSIGDWINSNLIIGDITGLQTALDGKSNTGHTHILTDITDVTITATNLNILDDGVNTTLHYHDSDRARGNHTGTQLKATISDFAHDILSASHSDTIASVRVRGDLLVAQGSPVKWDSLNIGVVKTYLRSDGTDATWNVILAGDLPTGIDATKIADGTVTNTEFQYINSLTSNAQDQIDSKQATITGGATTITSSDLTADRALISSGTGKVAVSSTVSTTELGYLDGVTSGIQGQIDAKLTTTLADGKIWVGNGSNVATAVTPSGDVTISNAGVNAIASDVIINADVKSDAAIAYSKLAALTDAHILVGSAANVATDVAVTGDVTITNAGVTAIGTGKVTSGMLAGSIDATKIADGSVTSTEFQYLDATSSIQTQFTGKLTTTLADGKIWIGNGSNVAVANTPTGDVTIGNTGVTAIGSGKVTDDMLAGSITASKITDTAVTLTATQTVSGKTLTAPKIVDGGFIADANGNELIIFGTTASAVNEIKISNGATTVPAKIIASGETNIGILLAGKGTGKIRIGDGADTTKLMTFELVGATTAKTMTITSSHTDNRTITLPDATTTLIGTGTTDTLTAKSISLTTNTITGTKAEFNTALSDDDFAYIGTTNTFSVDQNISATKKLFLDGGGDTYLLESASNVISVYAGAVNSVIITAAGLSVGAPAYSPVGIFTVTNESTANAWGIFDKYNATGGHEFRMRRARGTQASPTTISNNDVIADFSGHGHDGSNFIGVGLIRMRAAEDFTVGNNGTFISFQNTAVGSATLTEQMRLLAGGTLAIKSGKQFNLDGVTGAGDTYIYESSANVLDTYVGAVNLVKLSTTTMTVTGSGQFNGANLQVTTDGATSGLTSRSHGGIGVLNLQASLGSLGTPTKITSGTTVSQITTWGYQEVGATFSAVGRINLVADENYTDVARGSHMSFQVPTIGTVSLVERFRILDTGDISIVATKRLYLDGVAAGDDYLEATSNNNVLLNGKTTVALGVNGANVFSSTTTAITLTGTVAQTGKTITYNNITTAGIGNTTVFASFIGSSSSGSQANIISYTPPATAGTYRVSASIATTAGTNTGTITITITYVDAAGISKTILPPFSQTGSATLVTSCTGASLNFNLVGYTFTKNNSSTAITISTTVTGTVAYFVNAVLEQVA